MTEQDVGGAKHNEKAGNPLPAIRDHGLTRHRIVRALIADHRRDPDNWRPVHIPAEEVGPHVE